MNPDSTLTPPLLEVRGLRKEFPVRGRAPFVAVNDLSFDVRAGETLSIVGESGSGKTTLTRLILRLMEPTAGSVAFDGNVLGDLPANQLRKIRRQMQVVFQDPYSSMNPRMRVHDIVAEPLVTHEASTYGTKSAARGRVTELLESVGLDADAARRYPHEFSGGQRQRISIARAIALKPRLVVLDEPTSALDVSVQAQVLKLLSDLQHELGLTYIFVSHNLAVVGQISDRVAVMQHGTIVELGEAAQVLYSPADSYTRTLLDAVPIPDPRSAHRRRAVAGAT
ncbi:ATP-binding cassette domain-containing protein [Spelaeicoccus albus]|uniref:ABC-type oligopeptide transport system ATPase subunit n=1 Tax=Spelaeicoccus albus TaxID=1280376 RepID=A0A7Z0AC94_9MICO|nr:ATP-binding cassette domain-containing protein [Spelaeicoccus albus]NYI67048.1 ABC-type oligopeptide transport system ATPase subunit [Spelaeicoccus albus]